MEARDNGEIMVTLAQAMVDLPRSSVAVTDMGNVPAIFVTQLATARVPLVQPAGKVKFL